jgi:hypothetical protein
MNISTKEMFRFLGFMLKISIQPVDGGGYKAYFLSQNKYLCGQEIADSQGFAVKYMSLS